MHVTLIEKTSLTGIGSYVANLSRHLAGQVSLEVRTVQKWEVEVLGKRVGGALSPRLLRLDGPIPDHTDLVHATSSLSFPRRADVLTIHDLNPLRLPGMPVERALYKMQARRIRRLPAVITVAAAIRDDVIDTYRVDPDRVHAVPLGIDHELMHPGPAVSLDWDGPTVLYVGDYRPYKGMRELIEAAASMGSIHVVRVGPRPFDAYGRACVEAGNRLLGRRFHDLGYVPRTRLRDLYRSSQLLYFPSRFEGFGLPPVEAAACGLQSLVAPTALNRDHLGNAAHYLGPGTTRTKANGTMVEGGRALADALRAGLEEPIPSAHLVREAARFTWQATAKGTLAVYRQALAIKSAAA